MEPHLKLVPPARPGLSGFFSSPVETIDPAVAHALAAELERQSDEIELIASENIVSRAVLDAAGSVLTNKYAEGYPGRRYYGGCQHVDVVELLAIERACELFRCNFANVQPHSGSQANQAVLLAVAKPGDTILGMRLDSGGHLTHGAAPNLSGKWFNAVGYGLRKSDQRIDIDQVEALAHEHKPRVIIAGGSAYPRQIDFAAFRRIADAVGAYLMVDMAHIAGLVAAGLHPSPFPHAHVATSTTHKTLRGPRGGLVLTNDEDLAKKINSAMFPGLQGGPLMHVIAAKAVAFGEALTPAFNDYIAVGRGQCQRAVGKAEASWLRYRLRWHRYASRSGRSACEGTERQSVGAGARPRQYHLQQERRAVRYRKAHGHIGHSRWNAGRYDPRLRHRRIPDHRRPDRRSAGRPCETWARRQRRDRDRGQGAGESAVPRLPDLPQSLNQKAAFTGSDAMPGFKGLAVPGPTNMPFRVRQAMDVALEDHRAPDFPAFTLPLFADLKRIFQTTTGQVFIFPGSGTGGWESAIANTLSPGDTVLASVFGQFSLLWVDLCQRFGLEVDAIDVEWGKGVPLDLYRAHLEADKTHAIKAVLVTQNETATGVTSTSPVCAAFWMTSAPCSAVRRRRQLDRLDRLPDG